MIFRVCEHYENSDQNNNQNSDQNNNIADKKECFICFEDESGNMCKIIDLKEQTICIKNCLCNGYIHVECLKIWVDIHNSCPVCRKTVLEMNKIVFIVYKYSPVCINIYLNVKKIGIKFLSLLTFIILLYFTLDYFFTIVVLKNELYDVFIYKNSLKNLTVLFDLTDIN